MIKRLIAATCMLSSLFLSATSQTFSPGRLEGFYNQFLCQEKDELALAGLTSFCSLSPFGPPGDPPPPPFIAGYLPIVLVNNSTVPDSQVFVVMTGKDEATLTQSFMQFDGNGIGTLVMANPGDNATNHTVSLSQLPVASTGHVIYVPKVVGGVVWFSMQNELNMPVNAPHNIVQPNFTSSGDPNYQTNFDIFEVAYVSTGTNISADATAVSFFSIPLYGFMSTPAPGTPKNTGLFQPRSFIMSSAQSLFNGAVESSQWNNLFLRNGSTILRLASTGKAMAAGFFDQNYLDNAAAYGYSYIADIWSGGAGSFYRTHPLVITIPNGSLDTYTGVIDAVTSTITFTSAQHPSSIVVLKAPTTSAPTTSFNIFSGLFFIASDSSPGAADGIQLSKLFEEAIIAGVVPTATTLSNPFLLTQQPYYSVNPNLSAAGRSTGPWFDLYSKSLHTLGSIYTFAYDEPLWPQVLISSNTLIPNQTYMGITIGSVQ